jgi:hypothetical protein
MADPLYSWNDGAVRASILDFVGRVTRQGGSDFVPPAERIATFDNDGTLWSEQPLQVQFFFLADRGKQLAAKDSSMKERQPFKAFLEHDPKTLHSLGMQGLRSVRRDPGLSGRTHWQTHLALSDGAPRALGL